MALGMDVEEVFKIEPAEGILQPGEVLEFNITFLPKQLTRCVCWTSGWLSWAGWRDETAEVYCILYTV